jgi:hypothetical protein
VDTCVVTATNAGTTLTGRLDWCTREGVAFGRPVQGVAATSQVPAGKCRKDDAPDADTFCKFDDGMDSNFTSCTAGRDTVERIGTLQPTPCKRCRDCVANMQPYISSLSVSGAPTTPEGIGAAFADACAAPPFSRPTADCQDMRDFIARSNNGNLGRRAGELRQTDNLVIHKPVCMQHTMAHVVNGSSIGIKRSICLLDLAFRHE